MRRQRFLQWSGLGAMAIATGAIAPMVAHPIREPKTGGFGAAGPAVAAGPKGTAAGPPVRVEAIVIGAGVAGLAAARDLVADGWEVVVLEARDRLGGRIWTHQPTNLDYPLDLGASWLHETQGNPLVPLVRAAGMDWQVTDYDLDALYPRSVDPGAMGRGGMVPAAQRAQVAQVWRRVLAEQEVLRSLRISGEEITLGPAGSDAALVDDFDIVLAQMTLDPATRSHLRTVMMAEVEHEFGTTLAELSANEWDGSAGFGGEDVWFPGGYGALPRSLAAGLDVRLGMRVTAVDWGDREVVVTCDRGTFVGEVAIVTVPLGVLKAGSVRFTPPLPQGKQWAIERLGFGSLHKTFLAFAEPFWDRALTRFQRVVDLPLVSPPPANRLPPEPPEPWLDWYSFVPAGRSLLMGFNVGSAARALEAQSDAQVGAGAIAALRRTFGPGVPEPVGVWTSRWERDPLALGSYSYFAIGSTPDDCETLAEPLGDRVFFAGEATAVDYPATVHGALLSGRSAAAACMDLE